MVILLFLKDREHFQETFSNAAVLQHCNSHLNILRSGRQQGIRLGNKFVFLIVANEMIEPGRACAKMQCAVRKSYWVKSLWFSDAALSMSVEDNFD